MGDHLKELLAEDATELVRGSFTGVRAPWWWERRISGGIEVCQELDPEAMAREISEKTGRDASAVRRAVEEELGLGDGEPVVLTFEISGEATPQEAAQLLAERSSEPEGLAAGLYRRVESTVENG